MIRVNFKLLLAIMLGFVIGGVSAAGIRVSRQESLLTVPGLMVTGKAEIGGPFRLVDQAGHEFTEQQLPGKPSLIVFGHTRSDISSAALNVISQAVESAGPKAKTVRIILISLDWESDTPDVLKSYLQRYSPNIIGLSGNEEEIRHVASAFKVFLKRDTASDGSVVINHSPLVLAFNARGAYVSLLRLPTNVAAVASLLATLTE